LKQLEIDRQKILKQGEKVIDDYIFYIVGVHWYNRQKGAYIKLV